ncbi:putative cis-zeatin O-glucosyltransferase [Brachypodium distachyon]|uniref:putative cis-zeatin O-glucosyltransferase n=1 Tax=Brachypodium distachyon TaxID=15368 RepID=UPI0001C71778|nr:putative cis-zeatin O-glucosyltransferase [Brachypodium distachyon]|eukprot:XP_003565056.1 putative cis-zeatin O-glucosyltransferase [Brachypodium distachyon]
MESVAVVAVPFPMQGHLNQLLHLSLQLASRGLELHYAAPAAHVRQARARVQGWPAAALRSIHFHELGIAAFSAPPPDPDAASPFPTHIMPMWAAYIADAAAPLAALLRELSASRRRVVVVHDVLNSFAAVEAARLSKGNGESFGLYCGAVSYMVGMMHGAGHGLLRENGLEYAPMDAYVSKEFMDCAREQSSMAQAVSRGGGIITNTCRALEGEFVDAVAENLAAAGQKLFAVGPLNPLLEPDYRLDATAHGDQQPRHECLDWLDKQPAASVLYVSFGSTSSLRGAQVKELADALHGSKQRFIWVLRDADRGNVFTADADADTDRHANLLSEFTAQTKGTGLVITGWAPQLEILAHGATAAFMSHCGWNSTVESMSHGKPMLAWPMHSDQPWDAQFVCRHLKAGILVRPWEEHGEVTPAAAIRAAIETAMVGEEGKAMRARAMALGEAVRSCAAVGGSSREDLEVLVAHVTR